MVHLSSIHPLTDFLRNYKRHLKRLKKAGLPEVLTVNGRAEVVVQDAVSYQRLLDVLDRAEAIVGIRRGLREIEKGKGRSLAAFDARMRRKHKIPAEA
ncbi:MAG: type II toxin-antitoxin system Phd/YefM family antitoxin [Planctomycetes bacterium]|nr:type II toxin-antitoxin system Phd/YefM family antitoxin [Planctomycetota bacterium]